MPVLRLAAFVLLSLACGAGLAADEAPRTLRVPALGLRYQAVAQRFEPVPASLLAACPLGASGALWMYADARDGDQHYYVIGGRRDTDLVLRVDEEECMMFAEAREVFRSRYFLEIPQPVLQRLADDLARRAAAAFGGKSGMLAELHRQHVNVADISPELARAFAD